MIPTPRQRRPVRSGTSARASARSSAASPTRQQTALIIGQLKRRQHKNLRPQDTSNPTAGHCVSTSRASIIRTSYSADVVSKSCTERSYTRNVGESATARDGVGKGDRRPGRHSTGAPVRTSRPGVLLDRDGTIIVDHGYVGTVDRVEFIDGAAEAIARFNRAGIPLAVVTNQAGVARGYYGLDDVSRVHRHISDHLAKSGGHIDLFVYCPYHPAGVVEAFARTSEDRKPRPGMAKAAEAALNLNLKASWVVGDRPEDVGLAEAIGASAVYLGSDEAPRPGVWLFPSLAAAAPFILERVGQLERVSR